MAAVIPQIAERVICAGECWYETERCNWKSVWLQKWHATIFARSTSTRAGGTCVHKGRATSLTVWRRVLIGHDDSRSVCLCWDERDVSVNTERVRTHAARGKCTALQPARKAERSLNLVSLRVDQWSAIKQARGGQSERESNAHTMELTQKRQPDVHTLRHGRSSIETLSRRVNDSPRMPSR